jgi:hypothetical protein
MPNVWAACGSILFVHHPADLPPRVLLYRFLIQVLDDHVCHRLRSCLFLRARPCYWNCSDQNRTENSRGDADAILCHNSILSGLVISA